MSALVALYLLIALAVWTAVSAWQRAELGGPAYVTRRAHEAECRWCEPPGWTWTNGYSCNISNNDVRHYYPFRLSPWAALWCAVGWPGAALLLAASLIRDRLALRFALLVERRHYAQLEAAEVERIIKESAL